MNLRALSFLSEHTKLIFLHFQHYRANCSFQIIRAILMTDDGLTFINLCNQQCISFPDRSAPKKEQLISLIKPWMFSIFYENLKYCLIKDPADKSKSFLWKKRHLFIHLLSLNVHLLLPSYFLHDSPVFWYTNIKSMKISSTICWHFCTCINKLVK